jgi:hypothetical protein
MKRFSKSKNLRFEDHTLRFSLCKVQVLARYFAFDPKTSLSGWFHSGSVPENLGDFSS